MAFVGGKPQTHERFGGAAGPTVLFALLAHLAAGFRAAVEEHPGAAGGVVDVRWPEGEEAVVVLWLSQWNSDGPRARSR
jgi:hypothetical protein